MSTKRPVRLFPLLILGALVVVFVLRSLPRDLGSMPAWEFVDGQGQTRASGDYEGELVLIDFWATWCGPCRLAMPEIQRLHETYASRGLNVFGANVWERADPIAFMRSEGYTYPVLLGADRLADELGVEGIPTFVLVGPTGDIIYKSVGVPSEGESAELVKLIESKLDGLAG